MSGFFSGGRFHDLSEAEVRLLEGATARLHEAGIAAAQAEARLIWAQAAGGPAGPEGFEDMIAQRAARIPMSHILGWRDFYKHRFAVSADVLDPRPETETLIEAALQAPFARVLDLGTGSGCIVISLLAARPEATGLGTDLSPRALAVARDNASRIGVDARLDLAESDWFEGVAGRFDLIVSNPPYIAVSEMGDLSPELSFEPRMALTDGADGLSVYRLIAGNAARHLAPGGRLLVEIGHRQGTDVVEIFQTAGLRAVCVLRDLDGRDRIVSAQSPA